MSRSVPGIFSLALAVGGSAGCPSPVSLPAPIPLADHHMHIRSQAAADRQAELEAALGETPRAAEASNGSITAADAIHALDAAGIEGGLVFSNAYMYGMPDVPVEDERDKVRDENNYVASEVSRYPDRLIGYCSVNPLRAYALEEVQRCVTELGLGGLKLHLTNSDVDLRDEEDLGVLAGVFAQAERLSLPIAVHLRTRESDYGAQDADAFIDRVLPNAGTVPVQIAHMAGWGGYDEATDDALSAFAEAIDDGRLDPSRISFGLGAVVFQPEAAGADTALARGVRERNLLLAARMREIGVERIVYATDWPSWPPVADATTGIAANVRLIRAALPIEEPELAVLFGNIGQAFSPRVDRGRAPDPHNAGGGPTSNSGGTGPLFGGAWLH